MIATWYPQAGVQLDAVGPPNGWVTGIHSLGCGLGNTSCFTYIDRGLIFWLHAHPNPGFHLDHWTGMASVCGSTPYCQLVLPVDADDFNVVKAVWAADGGGGGGGGGGGCTIICE